LTLTKYMSWVGWAIAVGGPLLGIGAVMALAVAHEHSRQLRRLPLRLPPAPRPVRRASVTLLEEYLADERDASPTQRRRRHERLALQARRASTLVFEEFLEERAETEALDVRVPVAPPLAVPERPVVRRPTPIYDRAARPTRLVPLASEIAIN
jgi:hypothetical protein